MPTPEQHATNQRSFTASPALIAIVLLLAAIIINPLREMCNPDDSWSYARMVRHLLATGHYHLDAWAAANMPVQIYLAAGLSKIFGYSLSLLRCSTLCLFALGLGSFYRLLRELGHSPGTASILTLAIPASPLVLMLAFTFMSDVQFLGWLLLALLLYFRGIRDRSKVQVFLGSLAAACAIGTRQFGVAIVAGLVLACLWPSRNRPPARLLLLGIVVPASAAIAQIYVGFSAPNVTQILRIAETRELVSLPILTDVREVIWKCAVISQYIGMSFLPLIILAFKLPRASWSRTVLRIPVWLLGVLACAAILFGLAIPSNMTARPEARHHGLATPLEMYWLLPTQLWPLPRVMWVLDIGGIAGGVLLIILCLRALHLARPLTRLHPEKIFLAGTGVALLLMHLVYRQLNDTYIVALIPFAFLLFGEVLRGVALSRPMIRTCALVSIVFILSTALWMRAEYALQQAIWNSADDLLHAGIQPMNVWAPCWADYHGSFDAWVAAGTPGYNLNDRLHYADPLHDPYHLWLQSQWDRSPYRVMESSSLTVPAGWKFVASRSYRSAKFSRRFVLTLMRVPASPQPGDASLQQRDHAVVQSVEP